MLGGWLHGLEMKMMQIYVEENLFHKDPMAQKVVTSPPGKFYTIREAIDWEVLRQRDDYKLWVEPQDIIDVAGCMISSEGSVITPLFIHRDSSQGTFNAEEIKLLDSLIPHLQRAVILNQRFMERSASERPLAMVLDAMTTPTFIINMRGDVNYANQSAQRFIEEHHWLSIEHKVLTSSNSDLRKQMLVNFIHKSSHNFSREDDNGSVIHAEVDGERAAFCMQPINSGDDEHGGVLMFIHQHKQTIDEGKVPIVAELFHLTPAEAQVAVLLAQGLNVDAIAEFTGRQANTVRSQLKSTFTKTGVHSQSQLVSMLLSSPAFLM